MAIGVGWGRSGWLYVENGSAARFDEESWDESWTGRIAESEGEEVWDLDEAVEGDAVQVDKVVSTL